MSKRLDDILREFNKQINEDLGFPSSGFSIPKGGNPHAGSNRDGETPDSFKGNLDLHDAVDTLFYHFSIPAILDAMSDHIMLKAEGEGSDIDDRERMFNIASDLKRLSTRNT